uniref:Putative translation initiation factor-3 n=1 Tax=Culex tarsalis TaxID=7177 RepID=A0A1Q3FGZ0_CULTA
MNIFAKVVRSGFLRQPGTVRLIPPEVVSFAQLSSKSAKPPASDALAAPKKPKVAPKITLIALDQSLSIMNLDEAQRISKRRDLKLVKIIDLEMKTQRPVYKLMTSAEYLNEDLKRREEKKRTKAEATIKGDKLLTLSARITEHDLNSKIQNVVKWLRKSYEVRIVISGDGDKAKQESVATRIEQNTKEAGKIVQKRFRDNDLRFQIIPGTPSGTEREQEQPGSPTKTKQNAPVDNVNQSVRAFHTDARLLA